MGAPIVGGDVGYAFPVSFIGEATTTGDVQEAREKLAAISANG